MTATRYAPGQQDTIIVTVVDRNGAVVLDEVGQVYWTGPDGVRVGPTATVQPSAFVNRYEFDTPTFPNLPGKWWWYVVFTTPNVAVSGFVIVESNPAVPAA